MKSKTLGVGIALLLFTALHAQAVTIGAVQTTNGTALAWRLIIGTNLSADAGWEFVVGSQNVQLTALGIFDLNGDGLQTSHVVDLWTNTGTLVKSVTLPAGTASTLVGGYRYISVSPITLLAEHSYVLGAHFGPVPDVCGSACGDAMLVFGTETFAPGITYVRSRQNVSSIGDVAPKYPNLDAGVAGAFFGPNFLIDAPDPAPTPEPTTLGLAGFAIAALIFRTRQRRRP